MVMRGTEEAPRVEGEAMVGWEVKTADVGGKREGWLWLRRPGTEAGDRGVCRASWNSQWLRVGRCGGRAGVSRTESRKPEPELEARAKGVDWFLVVSSLRVSQEGCGVITVASAFRRGRF